MSIEATGVTNGQMDQPPGATGKGRGWLEQLSLASSQLRQSRLALRSLTEKQRELADANRRLREDIAISLAQLSELTQLGELTSRDVSGAAQRQASLAQMDWTEGNAYGLSHRELGVLELITDGYPDKQIAHVLGVSVYTINKHVGSIFLKMNAASRTEAAVRAIREGLVPWE